MTSTIPIFRSGLRRQTLTYWAPAINDGLGSSSFDAPVVAQCRWQDYVRTMIDVNGDEFTSESIVYPAIEVVVGGFLALRAHADANPKDVEGAREIRQIYDTPSLRGTARLIKAYL